MKKFFTNISNKYEERIELPIISRFKLFIEKHPEISCLLLLGFLCYLFLFFGLDFYPLLDVDETRYAVMSRDLAHSFDWNLLKLNGVPFLEKPPLYFWLTGLSVELFGQFNQFIVRLPMAILASFITFFTYFVGKMAISRKFGMYSALILLSSVFFFFLSHIAIIDMVLTVLLTSAIYCGFLAKFVQEKNKTYCWWYFYMFVGLGFLAKGLLAIALPIIVMFLYYFCKNDLKEMFKPVNILPGAIIFFALSLPWHILMYAVYGKQFIFQYYLIHHFARFVNSNMIGRERPLLYFIPVFIVGFMPWTFVFFAFLIDGWKKLVNRFDSAQGKLVDKLQALVKVENNEENLLLFATLYFVIVFVFFSISSTKLPTYILPVFPAASLLTGYFWWVADERHEHEKAIYNSTELFAAMFIIAAISASIVYWFLPLDLEAQLAPMKEFTLFGIYLLSILLLLRLKTKKPMSVFGAYILTMLFVIALGVNFIFNIVYQGGENEIVDFAQKASDSNGKLITFDFAVKPSSMIPYNGYIKYITDPNFKDLNEDLQYDGTVFVIVKNKNLLQNSDYKKYFPKFLKLFSEGNRYSVYVQLPKK